MATVKCVYCGERTDKLTAYRVPKSNKQNHFYYYCSEEEYQMYIRMQEEALAEKEAIRLEREEQKKLKAQKVAEREQQRLKKQKEREKLEIEKQKRNEQRQDLIEYILYEFLDYRTEQPFPTVLTKELSRFTGFYTYPMIKEAIKRGEETIRWRMNNLDDYATEFSKIRYIMTIIEGNIPQVFKEWEQEKKKKALIKSNEQLDIVNVNEIQYKKKLSNDISSFLEDGDI